MVAESWCVSPVHKLGHYGFVINKDDFAKTIEWYQTTFNLATTDAVYDPQTKVDETTFLHIDKGLEYSDHHVSLAQLHLSYSPCEPSCASLKEGL